MSLKMADLVAAARETTARQRSVVAEARLRSEAEELAAEGAGPGRLIGALCGPGVAVIAEVKGASPLHGRLRDEFDPVGLARGYSEHGASAVSVLTEEHFFAGSSEDLEAVSSAIDLPTLRKDFVVESYQIWQAAVCGASGVLLIAELLDGSALTEFTAMAHGVGLDALVELHRPRLLGHALDAGSGLVGINNRDLDTMQVELDHSLELASELPAEIVTVSESGISVAADVRRLARAGYDAVLVGTALVTADDPAGKLRELVEAGAREPAELADGVDDEGAANPGPGPSGRSPGSDEPGYALEQMLSKAILLPGPAPTVSPATRDASADVDEDEPGEL